MSLLIRNVGFGLIILGILLVLGWAIEPVRMIWPWIRALPWPLQVGFGAAVLGMAILLASLISERIRDRAKDRDLLDDY